MNVILCEDLPHLGEMGATVKVADGYARNYLLPRKLAVRADSASAKQIEHELQVIRRREEKKQAQMREVAKEIEQLTVEIKVRAGAEEKIFGSVTSTNIADKLAELGHIVDRRNVKLAEPIKTLGIYTVPVRLAREVDADIKVWVVAEEVSEEAVAPEEELEELKLGPPPGMYGDEDYDNDPDD